MSIQEQITALLNGELTDSSRVAELMHVLAVSPEKQTILVEQIRMSRLFGQMAGTITPSRAADEKILGSLAAIDAGLAGAVPIAGAVTGAAATSVTGAVVAGTTWSLLGRLGLAALVSLLLLSVGLGGGYILGARNAPTMARAADTLGNATFLLLAASRDSLEATSTRLQLLGDSYDQLLGEVGALRQKEQQQQGHERIQATTIEKLRASLAIASRAPRVIVMPSVEPVPLRGPIVPEPDPLHREPECTLAFRCRPPMRSRRLQCWSRGSRKRDVSALACEITSPNRFPVSTMPNLAREVTLHVHF